MMLCRGSEGPTRGRGNGAGALSDHGSPDCFCVSRCLVPPAALPARRDALPRSGSQVGSHHHPTQGDQSLLKRSTHRQLPGIQLQCRR